MSTVIGNLLDLMRVHSTAYIAKNLTAPWGIHIDAHPHLARFHFVVSGSTWIGIPGKDQAEKLEKGDIAIIPDGKAHAYFDDRTRPATLPKAYPTGTSVPRFELLDKDSKDTHLLCGYFEISEHTPKALMGHIPDLLIGRRSETNLGKKFDMVMELASEELSNPSAGSAVTLNRLTEVLCVHTIQDWFERTLDDNHSLRALADPKTKLVLDQIHDSPEAPWTVESLARLFGQSRTAFTSQFKLATGSSPMSYVRQWRIKLACTMLRDTGLTIDEIAFKSGYHDTNAFNRAFKRETGTSPGAFKRAAKP